MKHIIILLALACSCVHTTTASVSFSNLTYEMNPEYLKGKINVKVDGGKYSIGLDTDLLKKMDGNFWVAIVIAKKMDDTYVPIVDIKLDTCQTDPSEAESPLIRFVSTEAKKFVTFGLKCPYEPGHYAVNNFAFENSSALMNFIPKGMYQVSFTSHHQSPGSSQLNKVIILSFYADVQ
ncbi:uncharacterized protein LOC134225639 [Armigeres subalbatus]|uniref:uncharacterized protein LOC134225639 n=1 Tax=Armigeres subalbatus TaxID=124917 RepID=UPI002ED3F84B